MAKTNVGVADYLYFKAMEECGEATQAICKMFLGGVGGKWDDGRTNLEAVSEELSDVSTIISLLISLELIDNKKFWAKHDTKTKKLTEKIEAMIEKAKSTDDDSNGRETSSD